MIRDHDPIHPTLHCPPRVIHVLDPFQYNGALPITLQHLQLLPTMRRATPRRRDPRFARTRDVVLDLLPTMALFVFSPEHGIAETHGVTDALVERYIRVIEVPWPPREGPCVKSDDEDFEAVPLRALQDADRDFVVLGPIKLEPAVAGFA